MQIVSVSAFKGGVGKTTIAVLIANAFASSGARVLFIDLDHQLNSTLYFLPGPMVEGKSTIADAIKFNDLRSSIYPSHIIDVDVVPGSYRILEFRNAHTDTLGNLVHVIEDPYDFCVIDCPPTLDNLVVGSWKSADVILTPIRFDSFDLEGLRYLDHCIEAEIDTKSIRRLVVPNMVETTKKETKQTLDLRYEDVFRDRYPWISDIRIPRRSIYAKVLHDDHFISSAKRYIAAYQAILALASEVAGRDIVPREGRF